VKVSENPSRPRDAVADDLGYGLPVALPEEVGLSSERLARVGPVMRAYLDNGAVPGLLTVVARHGRVAHFEVQGHADAEREAPLAPDAIFRLFSMTKPVTAVAVMIAYEEGRFLLDDPIADYLPEFAAMMVWRDGRLTAAERPITIRHLLTHTSGFTYSTFADPAHPVARLYAEGDLHGVLNRLSGETLETHVRRLAQMPLVAEPGTAWHYGESMGVLGRLLEVVCGGSFRTFLTARLLEPLAMDDTDFHAPAQKAHRLAKLYELGADSRFSAVDAGAYGGDYGAPPPLEYGGAGLVGTAGDYLRFAQMLLNGGELGGVRVLSATSVRLILANHLGQEFGARPLASLPISWIARPGVGFGLGGFVVTDPVASGTAGSPGEYSWSGWANTHFWIDPRQELIGMVFAQVISTEPEIPMRRRMHQMTYQAIADA